MENKKVNNIKVIIITVNIIFPKDELLLIKFKKNTKLTLVLIIIELNRITRKLYIIKYIKFSMSDFLFNNLYCLLILNNLCKIIKIKNMLQYNAVPEA